MNNLNKNITSRDNAMAWWNNMLSAQKTRLCDTNTEIVGHVRRWETLTGSEIEKMYNINFCMQ